MQGGERREYGYVLNMLSSDIKLANDKAEGFFVDYYAYISTNRKSGQIANKNAFVFLLADF